MQEERHDSCLPGIRELHSTYVLEGRSEHPLLMLPEDVLEYLLSVLKDQPITPPEFTPDIRDGIILSLQPHLILPLLYWQLSRLPPAYRPEQEFISALEMIFTRSSAHVIRTDRQVEEILGALGGVGIRPIILKGYAFGRMLYSDPATRLYDDIDMLVHPEEMEKVREVMKELGYTCPHPAFGRSDAHNAEEYTRPGMRAPPVEIHWRYYTIAGGNTRSTEDFFRRAVDGPGFRTLNPVDALTFCAFHMVVKHTQSIRLNWIYDISLLARELQAPDDWEMLQNRCIEWGARRPVEVALRMAELWTGPVIPEGFEDFSTWPEPTPAEEASWKDAMARFSSVSSALSLSFSARPTAREKAAWLLEKARPSSGISSAHPDDSLPRLYLRHWSDLFRRFR